MAGRFVQRPTRTAVRGGQAGVSAGGTGEGGIPRQVAAAARVRRWVPEGPLDLGLVLGPLRRGPADPTFRATADGSVWRACRTPAGPGTLRVRAYGGEV
ncbi:DNA-3-methyladenine glycosylase 2 family protein, partial [Streptomyces sp. SID685]|nr:DNA-3-methyladenine glycosylase 2 family protein [Streptomyces sp. SID685]